MRTALIVDDNETVLRTLSFILDRSGYRVLSASSGPAALALMAGETADVALIDLLMPAMDGFQLCASLLAQARERNRTLHVWLMTGGISPEAQKQALKVGAVALLAKPFPADFVATIDRHCQGAVIAAPGPANVSPLTA